MPDSGSGFRLASPRTARARGYRARATRVVPAGSRHMDDIRPDCSSPLRWSTGTPVRLAHPGEQVPGSVTIGAGVEQFGVERMARNMSDGSQGPGWWVASDGRWYAPEQHPNYQVPRPIPPPPNPPAGFGQPPPSYIITTAPPKNRKKKGRVILMVLAGLGALIAILIAVLIIVGVFEGIHSGHSNSYRGGDGAVSRVVSSETPVDRGAGTGSVVVDRPIQRARPSPGSGTLR